MDEEKASSLAPELNNEDIPFKFDIILKGFRDRLIIADVMLNQLDMNTYATSNHKVFMAVPDHDDRDNCAEMDSSNKPEQQVGVPEYRALVAEIRQLKNQMVSVAGIKHVNCYSDDYHSDGDVPDSGGRDVSNGLLTNPGLD